MAVKQNNTEANGGSPNVNGTTTGGNANGKPIVGGTKNMDGGVNDVEQSGCNGAGGANQKLQKNIKGGGDDPLIGNGKNASGSKRNISNILQLIQIFQKNHKAFNSEQKILHVYKSLVKELSYVEVPTNSAELMKIFKVDIFKVGDFFAKSGNKRLYMVYLNSVCELISNADDEEETPSCAIAIIFDLFDSDMIVEAVKTLLDQKVPDQNIRCTVRVLTQWLRTCNFCTHLNLWILAILNGLLDQRKFILFDQVSLDNIDNIFLLMILPVLRAKVHPILFKMLARIYDTPQVFHKVVAQFPRVFSYLKQQSNNLDDEDEDTKKVTQKLVDITSALMLRFYDHGDLYEPVELAMKGYHPSENYINYINAFSDECANDATPQNNSNIRVGLVNLGNTCYMNSVLQALAMTKEFCREILLTSCKAPLLVKVQKQIALMLYSLRFELTPSCVLNDTRPSSFVPGLQQDSSEFLGHLLEILHDNEIAYYKKNNSLQFRCDEGKSFDDAGRGINGASALVPTGRHLTEDEGVSVYSTIDKTFTGKLATTLTCLTCGWKSRNVDSFRDFQLSFPEMESECSSNYSVQDLIDYYCSPEKLCGDNQYYCGQCKKLTDAERYINVITAPKNLILTLKHFKYDQKYHMRAKLLHKVFHDEKVSVKVCAPDTLEEVGTVHYDLYAGVVHSGTSMDAGHYYTYASDTENHWYKFNDNIVTVSTSEELHNLTPPNTPYILFYQMSARSNETHDAQASTKVVKVEVPIPPALDELPSELRDYIIRDNFTFNQEQRNRRFESLVQEYNPRRNYDDDDEQPPPKGGCGGNAMNVNINRFIY